MGDFLPILSLSADDVCPGALSAIAAGELGGVLIEGLLDADALCAINQRLDAPGGLPRTDFPGFADDPDPPRLYGRSLVDCPPDLRDYFDDAARFTAALGEMFDYDAMLVGALGRLGGTGRRARSAGGRSYSPATVRHLPGGHAIGLHIGNAFLMTPQAAPLAATVDVGAQLSVFVPLQLPLGGGELIVYDLRWEAVRERYAAGVDVRQEDPLVKWLLPLCDQVRLSPPAGAMLLFDGGRFFHRVTPVAGARARRTIGGFLARARDGSGWRYWS